MRKLDMRRVLAATVVALIPNYAYVSAVGSAAVDSLNTASSLPVLLQGRSNLFSDTQKQSVFFVYSPKKASKCSAYEHQVRKSGI